MLVSVRGRHPAAMGWPVGPRGGPLAAWALLAVGSRDPRSGTTSAGGADFLGCQQGAVGDDAAETGFVHALTIRCTALESGGQPGAARPSVKCTSPVCPAGGRIEWCGACRGRCHPAPAMRAPWSAATALIGAMLHRGPARRPSRQSRGEAGDGNAVPLCPPLGDLVDAAGRCRRRVLRYRTREAAMAASTRWASSMVGHRRQQRSRQDLLSGRGGQGVGPPARRRRRRAIQVKRQPRRAKLSTAATRSSRRLCR